MSDGQAILEHVTRITESLATVRTLDSLAKAIHSVVDGTVDVEYSGIYLIDFRTDALHLWYAKGFSKEEQAEAERTAWDRHPGQVIRERKLLHIPDTALDARSSSSKRTFHVRSRLWLPILNKDNAIGALGLASTLVDAFSQTHIVVLQYAASTAGFMYENLRDKWLLERQLEIAEAQRVELLTLSSPLVEVAKGIVVLPIIGRVEENRAQHALEMVANVIVHRHTSVIIVDLTGLATMDESAVEYLGRILRTVKLLGGDCVFSGISGPIASLITRLGVNIDSWTTFATVHQALATFLTRNKFLRR